LLGRNFPYGTLVVNILGCLFMGWLFVLFLERLALGSAWRAGILVGLLGAFTTFSIFTLETLTLVQQGVWLDAAANIALSVLACLVATWLGMIMGRQL
jgi:fluoride exporter